MLAFGFFLFVRAVCVVFGLLCLRSVFRFAFWVLVVLAFTVVSSVGLVGVWFCGFGCTCGFGFVLFVFVVLPWDCFWFCVLLFQVLFLLCFVVVGSGFVLRLRFWLSLITCFLLFWCVVLYVLLFACWMCVFLFLFGVCFLWGLGGFY